MYIGGLVRYSFYDLCLVITCIIPLTDDKLSILLCVEKRILHMLMANRANRANIPRKNGQKYRSLG